MAVTYVPLGDVDSFGSVVFDDFSTQKITYDLELISALVAVPGSPFPANRYGLSVIPHKQPIVEAVIGFVGRFGLNMIDPSAWNANAHVDVDTKVNQLVAKWLSVDPSTGIAGHTDTLNIWAADRSHKWTCTAFLYKMPIVSEAGHNWRHSLITCTWCLLSPLVNGG